jgi:hypothetical protein
VEEAALHGGSYEKLGTYLNKKKAGRKAGLGFNSAKTTLPPRI